MKHLNFIGTRVILEIQRGKFRLDYFSMLLIAVGSFVLLATAHLLQEHQISEYERELAQTRKNFEQYAATRMQLPAISGVEWSKLLERYVSSSPKYVYLNRVKGSGRGNKKVVFELIGQSQLDISKSKKNLGQLELCSRVELNKIEQSDEQVHFELECQIL